MNRLYTILSAVVVFALALAACAPAPAATQAPPPTGSPSTGVTEAPTAGPATESPAEEPVVLTFSNWQWTEAGKGDQWRALFAEFQAAHPNIQLEEVAVPYDRYEDTLYTRWAGGEGPDLVVFNDAMIAKAVQLGHLQPLDSLIDLNAKREGFSALQDLAASNGKTYGFVTEAVLYGLLYNPELFEQAGLDPNNPPTTVDEFLDACAKVGALGSDIIGYGVRNSMDQSGGWWYDYTAWVYGYGGRWAVDGVPTVNSPQNLEALKQFKRVYDSGCMTRGVTSATYRKAFGLGKVGMLTDNSAMINIYKNDSPDLKVGTAPLPFPQAMSVAEVLFVGISTDAKHPEEAAAFIEWFMQPEVYQKWMETILAPTGGLKQSVSDAWLTENTWAEPFVQAAQTGALGVSPEGLEAQTNEISKIVLSEIEAVLVSNKDPQEALDAAQKAVEELIQRSQ